MNVLKFDARAIFFDKNLNFEMNALTQKLDIWTAILEINEFYSSYKNSETFFLIILIVIKKDE